MEASTPADHVSVGLNKVGTRPDPAEGAAGARKARQTPTKLAYKANFGKKRK